MNTIRIMKGGESSMNKSTIIKVAGIVLPLVGAGLTFATNWLDDKKLDDKITEKVSEALSAKKE